jgi:uncharacterized alkaline shock family protein YloU
MSEDMKKADEKQFSDVNDNSEAEISAVNDTETAEEIGNIKISVDVISTIAGMAASEIEGVNCMYSSFAGGIAEMLGAKKGTGRGVKVEMSENSVLIDLYVVVDYGVRIPELAWEIQENVKNNVETMTGMEVEKVNIHIEGVSFAKETEAQKEDNTEKDIQQPEKMEISYGDTNDDEDADEDIND